MPASETELRLIQSITPPSYGPEWNVLAGWLAFVSAAHLHERTFGVPLSVQELQPFVGRLGLFFQLVLVGASGCTSARAFELLLDRQRVSSPSKRESQVENELIAKKLPPT